MYTLICHCFLPLFIHMFTILTKLMSAAIYTMFIYKNKALHISCCVLNVCVLCVFRVVSFRSVSFAFDLFLLHAFLGWRFNCAPLKRVCFYISTHVYLIATLPPIHWQQTQHVCIYVQVNRCRSHVCRCASARMIIVVPKSKRKKTCLVIKVTNL